MRAEDIRDGDIVEIDYIEEFTKEHINEGKALVIWKGFNHQPLVRKLNTRTTIWTCYEYIARVVGHIDIDGYMDKALNTAESENKEEIEILKAYRDKLSNSASNQLDKDIKAFDTAIKALEQEPCDKCVYSTKDGYCQYDDITEAIPPFKPCDDAISRQAVLDYIAKYLSQYLYNDVREAVEVIDEYIGELPSVNPQETVTEFADRCRECGKVKRGKWIKVSPADIYKCSACNRHKMVDNIYVYKYCHQCGARMEVDE